MEAQHIIYGDYSAATFVKPDGANAMIPYFTEHFSNPSSICSIAHESKNVMDAAQVLAEKTLGAGGDEIAVYPPAARGSCGEP